MKVFSVWDNQYVVICKDLAHVIIANLQNSIMVCVISFLIKNSELGITVIAVLNFFS